MNIFKKKFNSYKIVGAFIAGTLGCYYYSENVPRLGPIRALNLNWKFKSKIESVRTEDVEWIKQEITRPFSENDQSFNVVVGPQGIGKSVAINWAVNGMRGVIKTSSVSPGLSQEEILDKVCRHITGLKGSFSDNENSMRRVISWYKRFFGREPIVIIPATQRYLDQKPAQLTGAARILVDTFGLNVLIDCSENALTDCFTRRENIFAMEPMTNDMLFKIKYFEGVFETLKQQGNEEIMLEICNGTPLLLIQLKKLLSKCKSQEQKISQVRFFIMKNLSIAKSDIKRISTHPHMKEVYAL